MTTQLAIVADFVAALLAYIAAWEAGDDKTSKRIYIFVAAMLCFVGAGIVNILRLPP